MARFVVAVMVLGAVAMSASVATAQTVVMDIVAVKPAQADLPERYHPKGQVFVGNARSQFRLAVTFGTFDANFNFAAYADTPIDTVPIQAPAPAGGQTWSLLAPVTLKPNWGGPRICQAQLQYKLAGIVWVPCVQSDVWPPVGVTLIRWLTGVRDRPNEVATIHHFLQRHKTIKAIQILK